MLLLLVRGLELDMMKERVRGPIKCCKTIVAYVMNPTRAKKLVYTPGFQPKNKGTKQRHKEDSLGGFLTSRVLGLPVLKVDKDVLNNW